MIGNHYASLIPQREQQGFSQRVTHPVINGANFGEQPVTGVPLVQAVLIYFTLPIKVPLIDTITVTLSSELLGSGV